MQHPKCPKQEMLFSFVVLPEELPFLRKVSLRAHLRSCSACESNVASLKQRWQSLFTPEQVNINSSLLSVYSRLQKDETLILKGWKLGGGEANSRARASQSFVSGWAFRGAVAASFLAVLSIGLFSRTSFDKSKEMSNATQAFAPIAPSNIPFAQIRIEDKQQNRIQVHYVQPELLKTVEFETMSALK